MTQEEQVISKLHELGGAATLRKLYESVDFSSWKTKTPTASIRRIVQNSPKCYKIHPGLWGLSSMRTELEKQMSPEDEKFTHGYYQGILCSLGKIRNFTTFVPSQDKNRNFVKIPLKDVADTTEIPNFAFPEILRRAKTVDVIWFRENQMPESFYEVEHTTNIRNSIEKFCDLRDFYAGFYIVAHESRERAFHEIMNSSLFSEMRSRVRFCGYENLVRQYESEKELSTLPQRI